MPAIAMMYAAGERAREDFLNRVEVDGLVHLISLNKGRTGMHSKAGTIYYPTKLVLPNGKEPKIIRASSPIIAHIPFQERSEDDYSKEISEIIKVLSDGISEDAELDHYKNIYFRPNAFTLSQMRKRHREISLNYMGQEDFVWRFNLSFYEIKI